MNLKPIIKGVGMFVKKHKKLVIISAIVAVVGIIAVIFLGSNNSPTPVAVPSTTVLNKTKLEQITTVTGTVSSSTSRSVNSQVSAEIKEVLVDIGDTVQVGQALARLDATDINRNIRNAGSDIATAQSSADQENAWAQDDMNKARDNSNRANDTYNQTRDAYLNAEAACLADPSGCDQTGLREKNQAYQNADQARSQASNSLDQAQRAFDKQASTDSTKTARRQLEELQSQLKDYTITAPVAGVVTEMNATVGGSAGGGGSSMGSSATASSQSSALFLIEDVDSFSIELAVAEYDAMNVKVGNPVRISADSIDGKTWDAKVTKVSPKVIDGDFTVTVDILSEAGDLKIGMSISADVITGSVDDVFVVPYDAVVKNDAGEDVVYVIEMSDMLSNRPGFDPNFSQSRREVKVVTGMETDYYVEIKGEKLTSGLIILNDPNGANVVAENPNQMMMFNGGGMPSGDGGRIQGGGMPGGQGGNLRVR